MQRTVSAMVGKGSVNHNSRKFKAENVNAGRSHLNIDYCNENIKKVYHELFDKALERYNAKQTRADRKIENYYEKICNSKQEKPFHELILQVGDKENMSAESENGQLAMVMERHGIEWEHKGTHEKHLSVLDYKKQERTKEIEQLDTKLAEKTDEYKSISERVRTYDKAAETLKEMETALDTAPEYQLQEPQGLMTAKIYKSRIVEPLIKRLKALVKTVLVRYFQAIDDYHRLNITNANLYRENERLSKVNEKLAGENENLRAENKDYKLLRKVFGNKQIDSLLEQAKQSKQRDKRFRNKENER